MARRSQKDSNENYSEEEAAARMLAALRGARIAGHKPMSAIPRKRTIKQKTPRKKR